MEIIRKFASAFPKGMDNTSIQSSKFPENLSLKIVCRHFNTRAMAYCHNQFMITKNLDSHMHVVLVYNSSDAVQRFVVHFLRNNTDLQNLKFWMEQTFDSSDSETSKNVTIAGNWNFLAHLEKAAMGMWPKWLQPHHSNQGLRAIEKCRLLTRIPEWLASPTTETIATAKKGHN